MLLSVVGGGFRAYPKSKWGPESLTFAPLHAPRMECLPRGTPLRVVCDMGCPGVGVGTPPVLHLADKSRWHLSSGLELAPFSTSTAGCSLICPSRRLWTMVTGWAGQGTLT